MPKFRLHHQHRADECPVAFAAWRGFASPLRHHVTVASCAVGGHEIWWDVDAENEVHALAHLPRYVADRSKAIQVREIEIP